MARKGGKKRKQQLKTRGVKVRSRNKATSVTEKALNIMLWDLENNRIPIRFSRSVGKQFKAFLLEHGYNGDVVIQAFSAMRGTPTQRIPEEVITEFNKTGSDVEHFRIDSEEKQAADVAIQLRIDDLIKQLEDNKQAANFFIISSDAGFDKYFSKLNMAGHHTFMIYDKNSINEQYFLSVSAYCRCTFRELAALPKSKPK